MATPRDGNEGMVLTVQGGGYLPGDGAVGLAVVFA